MGQFVKAIEVWVPGLHELRLELGSAYYGSLEGFRGASEGMTFGLGEGLPGKTWEKGRPTILKDLHDPLFLRTEAADQAGLACAVAMPVFCGEFLQAVVVLFCGSETATGALEVWHNPQQSDFELRLEDGYFGELERFEWITRNLTIMRGRGLPGKAWADAAPVMIENLGESSAFLRASKAAEVGMTTGLAIPLSLREDNVQIFTLLSAKGTPIANRFEVWKPDEKRSSLSFVAGAAVSGEDLAQRYAAQAGCAAGEGALGQAWVTGRPAIHLGDFGDGEAYFALPVIHQGELAAVVGMVL